MPHRKHSTEYSRDDRCSEYPHKAVFACRGHFIAMRVKADQLTRMCLHIEQAPWPRCLHHKELAAQYNSVSPWEVR